MWSSLYIAPPILVALLEVNDYVHKGDIIISGDIKKDEELLKKVCARGKVYAEVWYMVNVSIPITKEERIKTGKKRYNLKIISPHFNDFIFMALNSISGLVSISFFLVIFNVFFKT